MPCPATNWASAYKKKTHENRHSRPRSGRGQAPTGIQTDDIALLSLDPRFRGGDGNNRTCTPTVDSIWGLDLGTRLFLKKESNRECAFCRSCMFPVRGECFKWHSHVIIRVIIIIIQRMSIAGYPLYHPPSSSWQRQASIYYTRK